MGGDAGGIMRDGGDGGSGSISAGGVGDGGNLGTANGQIALDCSIRPTRFENMYSISTTDFFFPLVDNPYLQGRIGAANVLSDLYATGVAECDFVLMLLAACRDMPPDQRSICTAEMVRGFRDACVIDAGTSITGGQTVLNPWPIIGGVATAIVKREEFILPDGAVPGDVVVLTKPLGTQVAVNVNQWRTSHSKQDTWQKCLSYISPQDAKDMMHAACCSMARLNRNAARLLLKYKAHACTDVTGFGILGHSQNLADNQKQAVAIEIHTLPCIKHTAAINDHVFNFRLTAGYSAETSGGLLVCLPDEATAQAFCRELENSDNNNITTPAWIIGRVVADETRKSRLTANCQVLDV